MPDRGLPFLLVLVPLVTGCTVSQHGTTTQLAQHTSAVSSVPCGAEFEAAEEVSPPSVQLASLRAVSLPEKASSQFAPLTPGMPRVEQYRIRNGDVVSVKFIKNPELDLATPLYPDGKLFLPLIGEIAAQGLTLPELRTVIGQQYRDFIAQTGYGEVLKEGDYFELRFIYNPELNLGVRIRSDGKISLPLLGEIQAAGSRPSELYQQLLKGYAKHLTDPDLALLVGPDTARKIFADEPFISVTLAKSADQEIFVGGEVFSPKAVKFEGQLSVLQAIMQAGGIKETGDLSRVVILRRGQFEQDNWVQTDLTDPLSGRSIKNDLVLRSGDVVIVPMSGIAKVDLFVKQYIRDVLPLQSNFNLTIIPVDTGQR